MKYLSISETGVVRYQRDDIVAFIDLGELVARLDALDDTDKEDMELEAFVDEALLDFHGVRSDLRTRTNTCGY